MDTSKETPKVTTRQWNDDEGNDLKARYLSDLHKLDMDEAEARSGYSELDESKNPCHDKKNQAISTFISAQERLHQDLIHLVEDSVESGDRLELNVEALWTENNELLDKLAKTFGSVKKSVDKDEDGGDDGLEKELGRLIQE